jgi:hypothetical protein
MKSALRNSPHCGDADLFQLGEEMEAAHARWAAASDDSAETLFAIAKRVFAIPAETAAGMLVKLRVDQMQEAWEFEGEVSTEAMASIVADITRLAGAAS